MDKGLLLKYIKGNASLSETKQVIDWIDSNPAHKEEYLKLRKWNDILIWNREEEEVNHVLSSKNTTRKSIYHWAIKVSGIAALLIIAFFLGKSFEDSSKISGVMQTLVVPEGQRAELTLSDGTKVWLNTNSIFSFPDHFAADNRTVKLEGEAFFDVARDSERLFTVETKRHKVNVHGTQFNVWAYSKSNKFETLLLRGSVSVFLKEKNTTTYLKPGEKLLDIKNNVTVEKIKDENSLMWKEGIISFSNETFSEIMKKLEIYFDITISVTDANKDLLNKRFTGKFRMKDGIEQVLKALDISKEFQYMHDVEKNIIVIK